jgi:poly-gamma-glutamate capsule biosynthesis protein CapA/YwtB (metallophosphatase superfamily)
LHDGDVTVGNLEGTLSVGGASKCGAVPVSGCFAFQAPPSVAGQLRTAGFGLVNQANNHSLDYGDNGRQQTVAALRQYGLSFTGLPGQITTVSIRAVRVAFVGFAPYPYDANLLDIPTAQALVRRARTQAQLVVVLIHDGAEGSAAIHTPTGPEYFLGEDRGDTRAFAHAVIDAGATVVLGSGPHVVRGVEDHNGQLIAYSLGNFVGYHTLAGGGVIDDSAILRATLAPRGRVLAARWIPITLLGGLPRPDRTGASTRLVRTLSAQDFPTDHWKIRSDGVFRIPATARR